MHYCCNSRASQMEKQVRTRPQQPLPGTAQPLALSARKTEALVVLHVRKYKKPLGATIFVGPHRENRLKWELGPYEHAFIHSLQCGNVVVGKDYASTLIKCYELSQMNLVEPLFDLCVASRRRLCRSKTPVSFYPRALVVKTSQSYTFMNPLHQRFEGLRVTHALTVLPKFFVCQNFRELV